MSATSPSARTKRADICPQGIPPGRFLDASGYIQPDAQRTEADHLREQTVRDLVGRCRDASDQLSRLKASLMLDLSAYAQMVAETWGVRITGRAGTVALVSPDGLERIERVVAPRMRVGVDALAAEALVAELLDELTAEVDPALRALVASMFRRDAAGNISPSRLLDFIRVEIDDPRWRRAQAAVRHSLQADGTTVYFRAYLRSDASQPWEQIPLDFSRVPWVDPDAAQEAKP